MKLKYKYIIAWMIAGIILFAFGYLQKITHHPSATLLLRLGNYTMIGGAVLLMMKVLLNKDTNSFLNK